MAKQPGRRGAPKPATSGASRKGRNRFGDPRDTLYTGGTPAFDETGGLLGPTSKKVKPAAGAAARSAGARRRKT